MSGQYAMETMSLEVITEYAKSDQAALLEFCKRSLPNLLRRVKHDCADLGYPDIFAGDACSEAIIRAVRIAHKKFEKNETLESVTIEFLRTIARNFIKDQIKRESKSCNLVDDFEQEDFSSNNQSRDELREQLLKYLDMLPGSQRDVLECICLEERSIAETAAHLNLSYDATYQRYRRGLDALRQNVDISEFLDY